MSSKNRKKTGGVKGKHAGKEPKVLSEEDILKRKQVSEILEKELSEFAGIGKTVCYKVSMEKKEFIRTKILYSILLILVVSGYVLLGIFETENSNRVIVLFPFLLSSVPVCLCMLDILRPLFMIEILSLRNHRELTVRIPRYCRFIMIMFLIMAGECLYFIISSAVRHRTCDIREILYLTGMIVYAVICCLLSKLASRLKGASSVMNAVR